MPGRTILVFGATLMCTGSPRTCALVKVVPALLVEKPPELEMELLTDSTASALTNPPSRLMPFTVAMAVEEVALPAAAETTDVSITPVDANGGSTTLATLLEFEIPVCSVQIRLTAVVPEVIELLPGVTDTLVP